MECVDERRVIQGSGLLAKYARCQSGLEVTADVVSASEV